VLLKILVFWDVIQIRYGETIQRDIIYTHHISEEHNFILTTIKN